MRTIKDLKGDLSEHLFAIDKTKLSMFDLKTYCEIIKLVDEMDKPGPDEFWKSAMNTLNSGFNSGYRPVEMKGKEAE